MEAEANSWLERIPAKWESAQSNFQTLQKAERDARNKYRRAADDAYESVVSLLAVLDGTEALKDLGEDLRTLADEVAENEPADMVEAVSEMSKRIGAVDGTKDIKSPLSKAKKALKAKTPDKEKALGYMNKALAAYAAQLVWREKAATSLAAPLASYEFEIRRTIGARQQPDLPRDLALYVARCSADHRDISLNF